MMPLLYFRRAHSDGGSTGSICVGDFDAQRERLDLEETLRTRLDSAECIQRNWLAYLRGALKEPECSLSQDRDARREELELQEDAAFQIQRCVQCYLFNRLLELRFQAAAQRSTPSESSDDE